MEECSVLECQKHSLETELHLACEENARLKHEVETALHGRIKENPDQCSATRPAGSIRIDNPFPGSAYEGFPSVKQVSPRCPTCSRS